MALNPESLRWGIVGPGEIARVFAQSLSTSGAGTVERVFGRRAERVQSFCDEFGGEPVSKPAHAWSPGEVDVLYIATPHSAHADAVRAALQLGTPVLCEKPLTPDPRTTAELLGLARETGTPLMEGWMYRTHPQFASLLEVLAADMIGRPLGIEARFGFDLPYDPDHRLFAPDMGGGGILDVGGYPLSLALAVGTITSQGRLELREANGDLAPSGVDCHAQGTFVFEGGLEARLECATDRELPMEARIVGEHGRITVHEPWLPEGRRDGRRAHLTIETKVKEQDVVLEAEHDMFALEARAMARLIQHNSTHGGLIEPEPPLMQHDETLRLSYLMADWRKGVGAR
jgi:predicted dehydrogenase